MKRKLRTDETAAVNDDLLADFINVGVSVIRRHDVGSVIAGQIGGDSGT